MTNDRSPAEIAERLSRRRGRILMAQGMIFLFWQLTYYAWAQTPEPLRTVDHVKLSAWSFWVLALLVLITTGGGWFRGAEVRRLLNDELTRDNRARAQATGFLLAVLSGLAVFVVNQYIEPVSTLDAIHLILSFAVGGAVLRFGLLERRGAREQ